jgi:hypothetical protein
MSLFFKAAMKCDMGVARDVPVYIDKKEVMEEQFRHDRLVEQCLQTEQLLNELEEQHKTTRSMQQSKQRSRDELADISVSTIGDGDDDTPTYRAPPHCTGHLSPEQRTPGSKAIYKTINDRTNLWKNKLEDEHLKAKQQEHEERKRDKESLSRREHEANRELNALVISRQVAAREAELEAVRRMGELETRKRRVHPIDVLQKRIAQQIEGEIVEGVRSLEYQLQNESMPVEEVYEDEQLKAISSYRSKMTRPKVLPQSNVLKY